MSVRAFLVYIHKNRRKYILRKKSMRKIFLRYFKVHLKNGILQMKVKYKLSCKYLCIAYWISC